MDYKEMWKELREQCLWLHQQGGRFVDPLVVVITMDYIERGKVDPYQGTKFEEAASEWCRSQGWREVK
jgi:hypothetical protein